MASSNKHLHITLDERKIIETGIFNGSTRTAIARTIGKDKSTVGREIDKSALNEAIAAAEAQSMLFGIMLMGAAAGLLRLRRKTSRS